MVQRRNYRPVLAGVQAYAGKDADGKNQYRSFTTSGKKEAEFMVAEFVAEQHGYECKLSTVSAIGQGENGIAVIATPQESYNMHLIKDIGAAKLKKLQAGAKEKLPVIVDAYDVLAGLIDKINSQG